MQPRVDASSPFACACMARVRSEQHAWGNGFSQNKAGAERTRGTILSCDGARRKNGVDVTQNINVSTNFDSLISYISSYARCGCFEGRKDGEILAKSGEKSRHQPVFFYARARVEALPRTRVRWRKSLSDIRTLPHFVTCSGSEHCLLRRF